MAKKTILAPMPTPAATTPSNLEVRQKAHEERLTTPAQERELLIKLKEEVANIKEDRAAAKKSFDQLDTERKGLQLHIKRLTEEKERLEKEDQDFAKEHLKHDKELKEVLEGNKKLAEEILQLIKG